ncbi:MAG: M28 family peptidase [Chloroflexi bacterium]|nr:M28 family peptidase [Chloroflexota bacterium]
MNKMSNKNRRVLISLIVVLALVQIVLLGYLWRLLRPDTTSSVATGPTPTPRFQLPLLDTATDTPDDTQSTPTPEEEAEAKQEVNEIIVEQPVDTVNIAALARMFDEELALEHIATLASDEFAGRQPGDPGGWAAGEYIAGRFAEYGLRPAGENDTYFQTFTAPYGQITELPLLDVILPSGEALARTYDYRTDYRVLTGGYLGAGQGDGPVVWLNDCLHDAYAGVDMGGKIALCRYTRNPEVYRQAIEHQVGGLLLLDRERDIPFFRRGGYRDTAWVPQTIPAYLVSETVAQDLLSGTDYTLDRLSLRFTATPLSTTVRLAVTVEEQDQAEVRNVLAFLPGTNTAPDDEIIVIGAHYDHLGREPDGEIMNGANDNASGVAAVLEIARLWQEQDYQPTHGVLFAAWDGEEQGLLGSWHYVEHPTIPLTRTAAMLNLDMIAAGENLQIDGEGIVANQLAASADVYGIPITRTFTGRSDHMPFYHAGVPSAMTIWWPDTVYHTPDDETEVIKSEKFKAVGAISAHTLAAFAEGYTELEQAIAWLEASVAAGNREVFLASVDPSDPDLQAAQAAWFDNLWSRELTYVKIKPGRIHIGDGEANIVLTTSYRWDDAERSASSTSYNVHFVQRDGRWYLGGYELDELVGDVVTVAHFPATRSEADVNSSLETGELLSSTQTAYVSLTTDLGFSPITGTRIVYYPDAATMQAVARPADSPTSQEESWLASSAGLAEIAWGWPITPALVNLTLSQMGLPLDTPFLENEGQSATWLREGMTLYYKDNAAREYLSLIVDTNVLTPLLEFPSISGLPNPQAQALRAYSWSAVEYLLDTYGADGLRALFAAWDDSETDVFKQALGISSTQFEFAWRADRINSLRADANAILANIADRVEAVHEGDVNALLSTVTPDDSVLRAEERNWFADRTDYPVVTYSAKGLVVGWSPGGPDENTNEAEVTLIVQTVLSDGQSSLVNYRARFTRVGSRWLYAGVAWDELVSEHFVVKYNANNHDTASVQHILDLAEVTYAQVTVDLDAIPRLPQEIKLYDDPGLFRASILLSLSDQVNSWTKPGEAIKLQVQDNMDASIARELSRQILFAQGLASLGTEERWLYEGITDFEVGRVLPLGAHRMAARYSSIVQDAVRRHVEFSLFDMPSLVDVPDDQTELFYAQSWSLVSFIVERYGLVGLRQFIAQTDDTSANLQTALNVSPDSFLAEWQEYALTSEVPDNLVSLAQSFDAERALAHVTVLASPELDGRQAGSPGANLAVDYVVEQFAALGLEPYGDLLTGTAVMTGERSYLQQFPISYTHLTTVPDLTLLDADGTMLYEFIYRQDFVESAGRGIIEGELVWVNAEDLAEMYFDGAVVVEQDSGDMMSLDRRAAQLQEHGAGGLIVVTDTGADILQTAYIQSDPGPEIVIPVMQITESAFETLLEQLEGIDLEDLASAPPALPLGVQMRQNLPRPITTTLTANVLGLLPGSDPNLAHEVLIVGAHYDHIGRSPNGFYFPGANQNASGVAAMLEMARVWQSTGYRPARSVIFAAWGAEELDSAGVAYYLTNPVIPLTRTVGVIALDSIAGGRGYKLMFQGGQEHDLALIQRIEAGAAKLDRRVWRQNDIDGWHRSFDEANIPALKFRWDEAELESYSSDDTADAVELDRLTSSGEILTLSMSWLAGW